MNGWLTVKEFAETIGRSIQRIYYLLDNGDSRLRTRKVGNLNLIHKDSARNFSAPKAQKSPTRQKAGPKARKRRPGATP